MSTATPQVCLRIGRLDEIPQIAPVVERLATDNGAGPKEAYFLVLALDELLTNVYEHGLQDGESAKVDICMWVEDGFNFCARTEDNSRPFNCTKAREPELNKPVEEREKKVGGMGIHLVKKVMDEFSYKHEDGKNIVTIRKDLRKRCGECACP